MSFLERLQLPDDAPGRSIHQIDLAATAAFTVAAVVATVWTALRIPYAVACCALFAAGTIAFLAAYGAALGRSRAEQITIPGIYGLSQSSPAAVQWRFHLLTAVQTVVAVTTAAIRPFTAQAFGILVPMLGLGLGGLWASRHGVFGERDDPRTQARRQVKESFDD